MIRLVDVLAAYLPGFRVIAARPANRADTHPARQYINAIRTGLSKKKLDLGNGVQLHFRTNAELKGKPGEYTLKFSYTHNNEEIPDLELVMYVGLDDIVGLFQARKLRAVSKEKLYKHTAKDEAFVLSSDPQTVCEDIKNHLGPQGELRKVALDLYKQAIRHLGTRHVENEQPAGEELNPFDYGMEVKRYLGSAQIHVDADIILTSPSVTALKDGVDVALKFKPIFKELKENVDDMQFILYLTTDSETGGVGVRKIRYKSDKRDYSDSDTKFWATLDSDPKQAAADLKDNLEGGPLGDIAREMGLRVVYSLNGGEAALLGLDTHVPAPGERGYKEEDSNVDEQGGGIDWAELGLEDPTK